MRAAILAIGSELLGTDRLDTNSLRLTEALERHGVELVGKAVVGDDEARIADEVGRFLRLADLLLVTGGLGPTADDVTRPAVARALDREVHFDEEILDDIREKFRRHGLEMPAVNRRQAQWIEGAMRIPNRRGTAPGMILERNGSTLFLLPGVPHELEGMIESHLEPWLAERGDGGGRERRTLLVACLPESEVEERIGPAYEELGREAISIFARPGEIRLRFQATGSENERRERLDRIEARLSELVGPAVFARGEEAALEGVVGGLLRETGATVGTAESCTGGLLAERFTRVAGSSDYFLGAAVTYTNELKQRLLRVPEAMLQEHGAVSEPVARAMAEGAIRELEADFGIGITGIAGPGGGTKDKPVGTVHLALAGPGEDGSLEVEHRRARFPGDRRQVREQTAQLALEMLRRRLMRRRGDRQESSENDTVAAGVGM